MRESSWRHGWMWAVLAVLGAVNATAAVEARVGDPSTTEIEQLLYEGRYREAEAAARELLPQVERATGSVSLETAVVLDHLAEALWRGGKSIFPETAEVAHRALLIRESLIGRDSLLFADSLARKAEILTAADQHAEAENLLVWALRIYEEFEPLDGPRLVRAHDRLGRLYRITWHLPQAEWHSVLALEIARSLPDRDELLLAETLYGLALYLHRDFASSQDTEPMIREVLSVRTEMLGEGHPLVAEANFLLAEILADGPRIREALDLHIQSLESMKRSLGPHHPEVAWCFYHLGTLLWSIGDSVAAEEALMRSIEIYSRYPELVRSAKPYNALGWFRQEAGDLISARMYKEQALGIVERAFGYDSAESGAILNNLGSVTYDLGDIEEAKQFFERGLHVATESHGVGSEATAVFLMNLAEVHLALGDFEAAEELARRAWVIDDRVSRAAIAARVLARVLRTRGKFQEAENFLGKAFAGHRAEGDSRNWVAVENHIEYGHLMVDMGRCEKAIQQYQEALSILEDQSRDRGPQAAAIRAEISDCLLESGEPEVALREILAAEQISRDHLRLMLTGMSEKVGLRYGAIRPLSLDRILSMVVDGEEAKWITNAIDAVIRSRALVLDEMATRRRMLSGGGARNRELVEHLTQARKRLAYLAVQGPTGDAADQVERFQRALAEATRERDQAERQLAEVSRSFRLAELGRRAGLEDVEAALLPGRALLGYKRFQRFPVVDSDHSSGTIPESLRAEESYAAFVIRPRGGVVRLLDLGDADEIDALVEEVRSKVVGEATATLGSSESRERSYRQFAERLRRRTWDPIAPFLAEVEVVYVVPDGSLNLVNFAALPVGRSGYFVEGDQRIQYLSAERDLIGDGENLLGEGLLALGNPDFDEESLFAALRPAEDIRVASLPATDPGVYSTYRGPRSACESFETMRFKPLPASELEVEDVVRTWSEGPRASGAAELTRAEAAESRFKGLAPGRRVLHLATHGFYLGGDCPVYEYQRLDGERWVSYSDLENPLLRSGLALAGANHRQTASPDEDDGILTAEEVAALDLSGVDWVVLSACESGLGDVQAGEGVFGLRRAFQIAGAHTLIMSLWPVDDESTRDWMRLLYRHRFVEGLQTIEAVHRTSLELLEARRAAGLSTHPFYWAGFVAAGDWR